MSDTPETDSYWDHWDRSGSNRDDRDKEFARRLERERDEARESKIRINTIRIEELRRADQMINDLESERDKLRAEKADLVAALNASVRVDWARRNLDGMDLLHPQRLGAQVELENSTHDFSTLRNEALTKAKEEA